MASRVVNLLAFAGAREVVGQAQQKLELGADTHTAGQLMEQLCRHFPDLVAYRAITRLAVNGRYAEDDAPVAHGDEVALIPPVAGG